MSKDQMFADPLDELYSSRREAYEAGKFSGQTEAISWARNMLSHLSVYYETRDDAKFHAVEECCGKLRLIAEGIKLEREKQKAGGEQ